MSKKQHHTMLCVGGPLAGKQFATRSEAGFAVPIANLEAVPDRLSKDYTPNQSVEIIQHHYHAEVFHTPQGDVAFWVPKNQTPLQTLMMLVEGYERTMRPEDNTNDK